MAASLPHVDGEPLRLIVGDGQHLGVRSDTFDTTVSIQVLEHVFEPIRMIGPPICVADANRLSRGSAAKSCLLISTVSRSSS